MCQGDSVSGTREVKLLFSIFCSTSTFIWNYLLSLLSAAATGSNVQWNNKQLSFRKYVLLTLTGESVSLPIGRLETRKTFPYFSIFKLLPLFLYFFKIYFGASLYICSGVTIASVLCHCYPLYLYLWWQGQCGTPLVSQGEMRKVDEVGKIFLMKQLWMMMNEQRQSW